MCGIFALLNCATETPVQKQNILQQFNKGQKRGPEESNIEYYTKRLALGFHRLAINGLDKASSQPLVYNNVVLICNGEIYNYQQLYYDMKIQPTTHSDCEVIIHLYLKYGIEHTLHVLDGVYAFVLYDITANKIYVARDPLGVRPLYKLYNTINNVPILYGFASELKCLEYYYNNSIYAYTLLQFQPGTYSQYSYISNCWQITQENKPHYTLPCSQPMIPYVGTMYENISGYLNYAVTKRCSTTERPVACLLSGGLDSSLIAALVAGYFHKQGKVIETYSIGLQGSEDIQHAKIVAEYIQSSHTEIIVTEQDMFDAIPEVIQSIESYDTTTVRASIGNYLLGKYISTHSDAKVIFNGDGSDELFGGYLYINCCPDDIEFDKETRRLLKDIHLFDVLRSDKSISSNGLEPRTPFLDRAFVNYILSLPSNIRNHTNFGTMEKDILRNSFTIPFFVDWKGRQILPDSILFRKKEAFSDGVSSTGKSLYSILQEKICMHYIEQNSIFDKSIHTEKRYYKELFETFFPNCSGIVPYMWMPKYIASSLSDPSARTLSIYSS